MGKYREMKLEYFTGSPTPLKAYMFFMNLFAVCSIVGLTWKITVAGYTDPTYFLIDFLMCAFSIIAVLSMQGFDRSTVFGNIAFLMVWLGCKAFSAYRVLSAAPDTGAVLAQSGGVMDPGAGMEMAGGAMEAMGSMEMGAMADGMMAGAAAAPAQPGAGLIEMAGAKLMQLLKINGDYSKFFTIVAVEVIGIFCLYFIFFFLSNYAFFKTSLAKFREQAEVS